MHKSHTGLMLVYKDPFFLPFSYPYRFSLFFKESLSVGEYWCFRSPAFFLLPLLWQIVRRGRRAKQHSSSCSEGTYGLHSPHFLCCWAKFGQKSCRREDNCSPCQNPMKESLKHGHFAEKLCCCDRHFIFDFLNAFFLKHEMWFHSAGTVLYTVNYHSVIRPR